VSIWGKAINLGSGTISDTNIVRKGERYFLTAGILFSLDRCLLMGDTNINIHVMISIWEGSRFGHLNPVTFDPFNC